MVSIGGIWRNEDPGTLLMGMQNGVATIDIVATISIESSIDIPPKMKNKITVRSRNLIYTQKN